MVRIPSYLKPGDTIGVVCPSGYMEAQHVQDCIDTLHEWGYHVKTGLTVGSASDNYFSGTDRERLTDLQQMLDDDKVAAILCARGGYGLTRIIDAISFKKFRRQPKWIIGFSDVTVLHSHIFSNYGIATIHGPMAGAFREIALMQQNATASAAEGLGGLREASAGDPGGENITRYLQVLREVLEGKKILYRCEVHPFNKRGEAVGELVGGNLALLAHAVGTPSDIKTRGKILFLEDTGEYLYNVDRMLRQLKRAGKLDRLAGLIVGGFTSGRDTLRPFGSTVEEIIREAVKEYDYPVCFGFPISHERENLAVKIGVGYKLKVGRNRVVLEE